MSPGGVSSSHCNGLFALEGLTFWGNLCPSNTTASLAPYFKVRVQEPVGRSTLSHCCNSFLTISATEAFCKSSNPVCRRSQSPNNKMNTINRSGVTQLLKSLKSC
jgi:hypothetical protein